MTKVNKKFTALAIILVGVSVILAIKAFKALKRHSASAMAQMRAMGKPDAPVKIFEYADYQCPACAQGAKYLKQFMMEHPDSIRLEMKYFPLQMHKHAVTAARYAECAARQGKFWFFNDYLFEHQDQWRNLEDPLPAFDLMAQETKLDNNRVKQCLQDPTVYEVISKHKEEGKGLGIQSTPTYYVNGQMAVGVPALTEELKKQIDVSPQPQVNHEIK